MNQRNAAMGLAALGRGADTSLIHMSPREIQALQQLAEQHGGSLTINPETGLPEAGFLNSLLPLIAGVGLSFIPGVNALGAGLLMGAGAGIASGGDLGQMAKWGLGGYGGASLGAGLAGAGAAAPGAAAPGAAGAAPGAVAGGGGVVAEDFRILSGGRDRPLTGDRADRVWRGGEIVCGRTLYACVPCYRSRSNRSSTSRRSRTLYAYVHCCRRSRSSSTRSRSNSTVGSTGCH
jgi:hypothetical protein